MAAPPCTPLIVLEGVFDVAFLQQRASHVEPNAQGQWLADLRPVNAPLLGPFPFRSAALAAERAWLDEHWLTRSPT